MAMKKSASKKNVVFKFVKPPESAKPANGIAHMRMAIDDRPARKATAKTQAMAPKEVAALRGRLQRHMSELANAMTHLECARTYIAAYVEFVNTTQDKAWCYGRGGAVLTRVLETSAELGKIHHDLRARSNALDGRKSATNVKAEGGGISQA